MMNLEQIARFFPGHLRLQKQAMLREYLQCVILEILFESSFAPKFSFLGGTCLRLVHGAARFSEDLDFDNFDLTDADFDAVSEHIKKGLEGQGFRVEVSNVHRGAYRCNIRFPGLLYYGFLDLKMSAGTPKLLRKAIFNVFDHVNLDDLAAEVRPFLFNPDDDRRVKYFREFWEQAPL